MPKGLPSKGIYGWDSDNETWVKIKVDSDGQIQIISTDITTILTELQSATYGLSAIETLVDEIESLLKNSTYGLSALETLVDDLEGRLTATRAGYLDELDFDLAGYLEDIRQKATTPAWDQDTDSLEAISEAIATVSSKTTNLPTDPADASDIAADFDRHLTSIDFWSDPIALINISSTSYDVVLPSVLIPGLPTGATIWKVGLIGYISVIRDTSGSDNAVNGACTIQIMVSTGDWGDDDITALDIPDNAFSVDVSTSPDRGGVPLIGNINNDNLSSVVTGPGLYYLRFEDIAADGNNLSLLDVQVGLRVWIY